MLIKLLKIPLFVIIFIAISCNLNLALANKDLSVHILPFVNKAFEGQKIKFTAYPTGYDGPLHYSWSGGGTLKTNVYTIPSIASNTLEITCTVSDDDDSATGTVSITIAKVILESVSFGSNHTMRADDSSIDYTAPHYYDSNLDGNAEKEYPICFTRNTKMSASVKWNIDIGSITPTPTIKIKGTGPGNLDFSTTTATPSGDVLTSGVMQCSSPFADEIDIMEPMAIKWSVSFDQLHWVEASSSNNTYVTLGNPLVSVSPLYETVVYLGCKNADGEDDSNGLFTGAWSAFSGGHVKRVDNTALKYYDSTIRPYDTDLTADTLAGLLNIGSGRCSTFQALFLDILNAQGCTNAVALNIGEDVSYVNQAISAYQTKYGHSPSVDGYDGIRDIFFVENWDLDSSDKWDAIDESGVAAQGNDNPLAVFATHALVKKGTQVYDPSYGTGPFTGVLHWENESVDGYGVQFYKDATRLSTNFLFWIGHKDIEDTQEVEEYNN